MSLEFLNPENRNAINNRRCSFCRRPGHNITTCNSERLVSFENSCISYINETESTANIMDEFKSFLSIIEQIDVELIKAFAVAKCNTTTRSPLNICVNNIIQYFRPVIETKEQQVQNPNIVVQQIPEINYPSNFLESVEHSPNAEGTVHLTRLLATPLRVLQYQYPDLFENPLSALAMLTLYDIMYSFNINDDLEKDKKFPITIEISKIQEDLNEKCECGICYENVKIKKFIKLNCNHEFCKNCIKNILINEEGNTAHCPFCRSAINNFKLRTEIIKEELAELII